MLGYLEEGSTGWLVIGSNGGGAHDPAWARNLAAHPEATVVLADGERVAVRAERLTGAELDQALSRIADEAPEYIEYRARTRREIPVIRLRRIDA